MPATTSSATAAHPIQTLREHATLLEAAITVALAGPTPKAVHKLRTQSCRIEALLGLLTHLKDLPPFRTKAAKIVRQLKKLRRAAGRVRDLDVQQRLIEDHTPETLSQKDSEELQQTRARLRKRVARKLLKLLAERQQKISRRLESLLAALEPAANLKLSPTDLLRLVERDFHSIHAFIIRNPSEEHLHSIRKTAKLARYQAELAPDSLSAKRIAKFYRSIQETGGHWHDWLELAAAASSELGDNHRTAIHFNQLRDRYLDTYRDQLETLNKLKRSA